MSVATEITRLQNAKSALKSAIENKGVTVPSSTKLDGYASLVNSIPGIVPEGTINITENGENIDVKQYATANVDVYQPDIPEEDTLLGHVNVVWKNSSDVKQSVILSIADSQDVAYDTHPIVTFGMIWSDYSGIDRWDPTKVQYTEQEYGRTESEKCHIPAGNIIYDAATAGDVGYRLVTVILPEIFVQTGGTTDVRLYYENQLIVLLDVNSND